MAPFEKALAFVLRHEGGYSNDPRDSGGETKFGISKRAYPDEDIANLTPERAGELYKRDYWDKCSCGLLPSPIALILFDCAVNQGPAKAIRLLQAALGGLESDGVIGPKTLQAIQNAGALSILPSFVAKRAYQYALHPQFNVYGYGWLKRLAACHQTSLEPL